MSKYLAYLIGVAVALMWVWGILWVGSWQERARCQDALLGRRQALLQSHGAWQFFQHEVVEWCGASFSPLDEET